MKKILLALFIVLIQLPCSAGIRVMSYNIRLGVADDGENSWENRREATPAMLRDIRPDVFGVQEAFDFQIAYILENCPEYKAVGVGRDDGVELGEHMSVFYNCERFNLVDWGTYWLSETPDVPSFGWDAACRRTATWTLLEEKDSGERFYFVNTHLDHIGVVARREGLALIHRKISEMNSDGLPMVLTGDFNVLPDNPGLGGINSLMKAARFNNQGGDRCGSFNGFGKLGNSDAAPVLGEKEDLNVLQPFDYIYYSGFEVCSQFRVARKEYCGKRYISDHYPVWADIHKKASYTNPIIPGMHPDPSVCRVGEDYYIVCSSFQFFPGVPLMHSKDLVHWEQAANVLDRESQLRLSDAGAWNGIYAPTIRYNDGRWYMVTTNVSDKGNFFVWAEKPEGPWSDPIWLEQGGIDPSFFFEDGKCYFCSNPTDGIKLCEIDIETGRQLTPSREIWAGDGGRYPEAPHIYKKDGWYYLMIAEGGTEYGHSETIARSRNIYGPYESNPANPILTNQRQRSQGCEIQGTGHADLVQDHEGNWWIVCLGFRIQNGNHHLLGRETFLLPVEWVDGWPVVNGDGRTEPLMVADMLPQKWPDGTPLKDGEPQWKGNGAAFASGKFGPEWIWLDNPVMENYEWLADGSLLLKGSSVSLDDYGISPTFVALRQESKTQKSSTSVALEKGAAKGSRAGLSVYMGNFAHCDIFVTPLSASKWKVSVEYSGLAGLHKELGCVVIGSKAPVTLRIESSQEGFNFSCTAADGTYTHLGYLDCRYLSTETVGGFTGLVQGLFATDCNAVFSSYDISL